MRSIANMLYPGVSVCGEHCESGTFKHPGCGDCNVYVRISVITEWLAISGCDLV